MKKTATATLEPATIVEQAFPQVRRLLLALDGHADARRWLEDNSPGTALLARLLGGEGAALAKLNNGVLAHLDDLFEMVDNDDLGRFLQERHPALHLLFAALAGDPDAAKALKRAAPAYHRHLPGLRAAHERFLEHGGPEPFGESAADMGCLVGEMHLRQGEYEKAIEAFSRAIESTPAADLYEGRARAFKGLAEQDMERAQLIRQAAR
ncbi:MAG: tetratricopeptide repeat protein [Gemmataceae bacterium]|nr:tetratricopeptide repeat protein [Gemmataceae bacterium]